MGERQKIERMRVDSIGTTFGLLLLMEPNNLLLIRLVVTMVLMMAIAIEAIKMRKKLLGRMLIQNFQSPNRLVVT